MGEPKGFLVVPIGYNPSDQLRSLELDASDNLKVAFAAAAQGLVGEHGWIGDAWQKNPLLLGYTDTMRESVSNVNLPAGTSVLASTAVPAGEIHVITNFVVRYDGTVPAEIDAELVLDSSDVALFNVRIPVSGQFYDRQGYWVLGPGDYARLVIVGATLGDDGYLRITGFRVDIDQ